MAASPAQGGRLTDAVSCPDAICMLKTIVVVNDFAHINGGAGKVALTSAIRLAQQGYQVIVFAAVEPIMPGLVAAGVRVVVTGQYEILKDPDRLRAAVQGIWNRKAQEMMATVLSSLDPASAILHVHSWTKALSTSFIRVAIQRGFRVICTLHDYFSACPNGGFFDYQRSAICKEVPLSLGCISRNCDVRSYPQKGWRVARQFVQRSAGKMPAGVKHFITISDFSESILRPYLPSDAILYRVENPIDAERRACIDVRANDALTFVGRLSPEKGVVMLAAAVQRLEANVTFVGEGECRRTIESICPKAHITGWVAGDEVGRYLAAARALILPSLWYEASPLVIAEAAALGIPSIVADTCAAKDMVEDGRTGFWFRGGNEDDLQEKMRFILQPDVAAKLGEAAYQAYWDAPRTLDGHVAKLERCYRHALS